MVEDKVYKDKSELVVKAKEANVSEEVIEAMGGNVECLKRAIEVENAQTYKGRRSAFRKLMTDSATYQGQYAPAKIAKAYGVPEGAITDSIKNNYDLLADNIYLFTTENISESDKRSIIKSSLSSINDQKEKINFYFLMLLIMAQAIFNQ
jgi:hypothetical protein